MGSYKPSQSEQNDFMFWNPNFGQTSAASTHVSELLQSICIRILTFWNLYQILDTGLCTTQNNLSGGGNPTLPSDIHAKHNPFFDCIQYFHWYLYCGFFSSKMSAIFDLWLLSWLQFARSKLSEIASEVDWVSETASLHWPWHVWGQELLDILKRLKLHFWNFRHFI